MSDLTPGAIANKTVTEKTAPAKPAVTRLSGNVSAELAAFLNEHRFDVRKDKGEFLEYALTEYAKSVGYSPKV